MMPVVDCISEMISTSEGLFETDQERVVATILQAEKIFFLDTCFITKSFNIETTDLLKAFENIAGGKAKIKIVFVLISCKKRIKNFFVICQSMVFVCFC